MLTSKSYASVAYDFAWGRHHAMYVRNYSISLKSFKNSIITGILSPLRVTLKNILVFKNRNISWVQK